MNRDGKLCVEQVQEKDAEMAKAVETEIKWKILRWLVVERRRLTKKNEHMATHVQRGVDHLSMFAGAPGVLELLSWTEGAFDVHIVFPLYEKVCTHTCNANNSQDSAVATNCSGYGNTFLQV